MSEITTTPPTTPPAKPPAEPPEAQTVTLTIDEQEVTVAKGTNVIEAAKELGVNVSAFCYHPGLSIAACCRQCLVEIEGMPKLQPSCQITANDGMVVRTTAKRAVTARRQLLEFTLLNHPIDCPICDKAGECTLQSNYFDSNNQASRLDVPKVRKPKVKDLGPTIILDAERCILCTRCIRVCDEVAGEHQLEMINRGDHEELTTAPGESLDNPYSLNTVDVCPVGALTSKDYRFTMRSWELMMTPSVCNGCSTGCNIEVHHRENRVWRLVPRENQQVNKYWMCDEGRLTYHGMRESRLAAPQIDGMPASWERALAKAGEVLKAALADKGALGVVLSAKHTNEDNYVLAKLTREHWGLSRFYIGGEQHNPERADEILRESDTNPNTKGVMTLMPDARPLYELESDIESGSIRALIVLGHELSLSQEGAASVNRIDKVIMMSAYATELADSAAVALPINDWAETHGTVTNKDGITQRMHAAMQPPGQSAPAWQVVTRLARAADAALDYKDGKAVFTELASASSITPDTWGREVMPIQLRFAHSRG